MNVEGVSQDASHSPVAKDWKHVDSYLHKESHVLDILHHVLEAPLTSPAGGVEGCACGGQSGSVAPMEQSVVVCNAGAVACV